MSDNVSNAIRLRLLVLRLSDTLGDLANDEASIPDDPGIRDCVSAWPSWMSTS